MLQPAMLVYQRVIPWKKMTKANNSKWILIPLPASHLAAPVYNGAHNKHLVVPNTFEKYARQIGSFPQVGLNIKNIWNHHLDDTKNGTQLHVQQ